MRSNRRNSCCLSQTGYGSGDDDDDDDDGDDDDNGDITTTTMMTITITKTKTITVNGTHFQLLFPQKSPSLVPASLAMIAACCI